VSGVTLAIKNIGKLIEASVQLNGITIIAGENNSGKSTVGKVLFSVINSLGNDNARIDLERQRNISKLIYNSCRNANLHLPRGIFSPLLEELFENETLAGKSEQLAGWLSKSHLMKTLDSESIKVIADEVYEVMSVPEDIIWKRIIASKLQREFSGQLANMHFPENLPEITIANANTKVELIIKDGEIVNHPDFASFNKEAFYIDNPFILDEGSMRGFSDAAPTTQRLNFSRRFHLLSCINDSMESEINALGDILKERKLNRALELLNKVCSGSLKVEKRGEYVYNESGSAVSFNIGNVSTGLKTFIIIKTLIMNDCLKTGDILILDEPEIHLHPEWQIVLAELIVLIQKEFSIIVLMNTHSLYFLRAVEVYAKKHGIDDKCKYYQCNSAEATIRDVTETIDDIYKTMAYPLQILKNEEYAND